MSPRRRRALLRAARAVAVVVLALVLIVPWALPRVLSIIIVDRVNLPRFATPTLPYRSVSFRSGDVELSGWLFEPAGPPRGLVVHLHGRMYTRVGGIATAEVLVPRGYAVFAYDQRAHGASGGAHCTYGQLEKADLARAIDILGISPVYVVGHSLGAAVALQAAGEDHRIRGVVAASCYSDLRTALVERAAGMPFMNEKEAGDVIRLAEAKGSFLVDDVSPLAAAARVDVPVLLVHGSLDENTPPIHSRRLLAALHGPKQLYVVEGANHTELLDSSSGPVWGEIVRFIEAMPP